ITQSANHQMVAADLPANRFAEFYLQPEQMVAGFGTAAAQMFGMDMKLTAPAGLPPIGMAFAADGNVLSAEVVVPAKSIDGTAKFVRDTINKAFGGGGGGDDEGGKADEDL
ncbi:MAG TPA: hypothetical protein PK402_11150, partial [Tepidisphaeraceae bacterium]|nr:hypothetical protein [Tepidisphaeraceae bacterium]